MNNDIYIYIIVMNRIPCWISEMIHNMRYLDDICQINVVGDRLWLQGCSRNFWQDEHYQLQTFWIVFFGYPLVIKCALGISHIFRGEKHVGTSMGTILRFIAGICLISGRRLSHKIAQQISGC